MEDFKPNKRIRVFELQAGDRLLLTSDELTDVLDDNGLLKLLDHIQNPQDAAATLTQHALDHDVSDDITCLVFDVIGPQSPGGGASIFERLRNAWQECCGKQDSN